MGRGHVTFQLAAQSNSLGRINRNILILEWKPTIRFSFDGLSTFGQSGFAFLYLSPTAPQRNFSARSVFDHFFGKHTFESLYRVYFSGVKNVILVRRKDFHPQAQ